MKNKELIDLRKIICLRKFESLTCHNISTGMYDEISGAWHSLHAFAETE